MKLTGQIAVVTGAGRGIGKAIALTLASHGATVVLVSRTLGELEQVQKEISSKGGTAAVIRSDITRDQEVSELFAAVKRQFGRLDILVNNAGMGKFQNIRNLKVEEFDAMWSLNVRALFLCTQHALGIMESQKNGLIVNISSLAGKNAFVGGGGYAATKWALMGFSKCLMLEERQYNIRVITVCPGSVETTFSDHESEAARADKILSPQDVADTVLSAILMPPRAMVSEIDIRPTNPK